MYWIFSALVGSLDTPSTDSKSWYKFLFRFLHSIAGNINRAAITFRVPGSNGTLDGIHNNGK